MREVVISQLPGQRAERTVARGARAGDVVPHALEGGWRHMLATLSELFAQPCEVARTGNFALIQLLDALTQYLDRLGYVVLVAFHVAKIANSWQISVISRRFFHEWWCFLVT